MQVASTLWPSRKSQKISKYQFRLKQTKCSPRTEAKQVKTAQPPAVGGGWRPGQAGRPIGRPTRSMGPIASTLPRGASLLLLQVGLGCCDRWFPPINTREGVENRTHTHTHTSLHSPLKFLLAQSLGLVEFRRSLGVIESPELLESLVWFYLQLSLL